MPAMPVPAASWTRILASYREVHTARSIGELLITGLPFVAIWASMWLSLQVGYWLCLILAVPAAALLMRLFMIQHDCGHGAMFRSRSANDWTGRTIGVLTLTPYGFWRRTHATHHAAVGNLDRRGVGDIETLTVAEYGRLTGTGRLRYRLYRHPLVMFGLIPAYLFLLHHRLPFGLMRSGLQPWISTMGTNLSIAVLVTAMILWIGFWPFVLIQMPIVLIAATVAVWFFYVQHQFEDTEWSHESAWTLPTAALQGSSYYELPPLLAWFSGNIGVHHVHHLASRIPFYRLPQVLREHPELATTGRMTFRESFRTARLALWDEKTRQLVAFRDLRGRHRTG